MSHIPFRIRITRQFCLLLWIAALGGSCAGQTPDDLLAPLPNEIGGVGVDVPPPSLQDGLDAEAQRRVLKEVAGKYSLERFTKDSIVAPFTLNRQTIKNNDEQRVGHQIDLWFVAYGNLAALEDEDLLMSIFDGGNESAMDEGSRLAEASLARRGLKTISSDGCEVEYYRFAAPVLNKVVVEGVARRVSIVTEHSRATSIALETAFDSDAEFPNQWRHRDADASSAVAYTGYGGYAKATLLRGMDNAMLIECHAVVHEPKGWFDGANLLGSKLPIAIQNAVRNYRRTLSKQR